MSRAEPPENTAGRALSERPSIIVVGGCFSIALAFLAIRPLTDPDAWWNLRAGQYLVATGSFTGPDPWSSVTTQPFVLTEWLGSVAAAVLFSQVGTAALIWMRTVGVVTLAILMLWSARRQADFIPSVLATLVALFSASGSLAERPQLLGIVFFMVSVVGWRSAAATRRPPWWLVPLTWLAACAHGYWVLGVVLGLVTAACCALSDRSWRTAVRLCAPVGGMVLAAALTPVGPALLLLPTRVHAAAGGLVDEWRAANVGDPLVATSLVAAGVIAVSWLFRSSTWWERGHLAFAVVLTLSYARLTAVAACVLVPLLAGALQFSLRRAPAKRTTSTEARVAAAGAVFVLLLGTLLARPLSHHDRTSPGSLGGDLQKVPSGAVLLDDYNVSSWLLANHPRLRLVIDSRTELYSPEYLRRYVSAWQARPGWRAFVSQSGASWALLRENAPLADALMRRAHWREVSSSGGYVLLTEDL